MVDRVAGWVKQGYWFGHKNSTCAFGITFTGTELWDLGADDSIIPAGTYGIEVFGVLQNYGTIAYFDSFDAFDMVFILENCKFPLEADGQMPASVKSDIIAEVLAVTGEPITISADSGAWFNSTRGVGHVLGTGEIANVTSHS